MNVVLPNDASRGPRIEDGPGQRPLCQSSVKALYDLGGGEKADKFLRLDHKHSMVFLISGKVIDQTSLTKDHHGDFKPIKWLDGARETTAIRCGGKHRTHALMLCLQSTISMLTKLNHMWLKDQRNQELLKKVTELRSICDLEGYWTIKIYNKG